jgi:iron complex outermembrane receptor protein
VRPIGRVERLAALLTVVGLLASYSARGAGNLSSTVDFSIEAQPLPSAVLRYSEQSGVQVTSSSELLVGKQSRGVTGRQTALAALRRLLAGTGLTFEAVNPNTVAIRPLEPAAATAYPYRAPRSGVSESAASGAPTADAIRSASKPDYTPRSSQADGVIESPSVLEEVLVSSRKIAESLLDVPQSVTALSERTLQQFNVQSFTDYATKTPNLSFAYGTGMLGFATSRSVAIRGITGAGTTALYIDDTPVPESIDPRVVDIERIEVLKGPQGTLYGQSSLGGNVRLITVQPSFTNPDAHVSVQAGATSGGGSADFGADVADTLTVVPDRVVLRAVAFVNHDAGFLSRSFFTDNGAGQGSNDNQGASVTFGGSLSMLSRITDNLDVTIRLMFQQQDDHGWPATWAQLPQFVPASYRLNRVADVQEIATDSWYLPSLQFAYQGHGWGLSSSTSYFSRDAHDIEDGTEGTADVLALFYGLRVDPYRPIPWDGYYADHRVEHETRVTIAKTHGFSAVMGVFVSKVVDNGILNSHDIPGIAAAGLWPTDLGWYSLNENESRGNALFGELYYDVAHWEVTLGLRRYDLREDGLVYVAGALNGQVTDQILQQTSQQGISPKLAVSYKFTPDTMMYGLASKGFRAGGAGRVLPSICEPFPPGLDLEPNQPTSYGSDSVWNYEVGAKTTLLDDRVLLTSSAFDMNWTDIQQSVTLPRCFITFITNAGAARARGGEFEASGHPWQPLEVRIGLGFDNAVITNEGFSQQPVGSRVYQIPRWTWSAGGTYTVSLTQTLKGFLTLDLSHVGDSVSGTSGIGTGLTRPSYTILNGRMGVDWSANELALYAKNIADERANFGDLNPISYDPEEANGMRMLRIAVLPPLQVGLQYRHAF